MSTFRDPLDLDGLLTEEERMVQQTARSFVDSKLRPIIVDHYRAGTFPREVVPELGAMGYLGASLEGYGCAGIGEVAYGIILQEIERCDSGLRSFTSVQGSLAMFAIHRFGAEEQKQRWLPKLAAGEAIGCFGLTEPDFGSNPAAMRTRATSDGDHFVLNGSKMWITNGSLSDVAVVFARADDDIRGFLLERGTPGFTATDIKGKLSLRASVTSELSFEDCRIPASALLPEAVGLKSALMCLNKARLGIAWGVLGAGWACFEETLAYAKERVQFDRPIAGFQLVQAKLSQMWIDLAQAQLLVHRVGRMAEDGTVDHVGISIAKRTCVRTALETARTCRDILGANGVVDAYSVMRHMSNIEAVSTYEGTHDIHGLILGHRITGINAFAS